VRGKGVGLDMWCEMVRERGEKGVGRHRREEGERWRGRGWHCKTGVWRDGLGEISEGERWEKGTKIWIGSRKRGLRIEYGKVK